MLFTVSLGWSQPGAVFDRYCLGCHNSTAKVGGLELRADAGPAVLEKVVRRLRVRSMPPAGMPRPDDATYISLIASLEGELDRQAAAHPNPGRTETFRRLNRTEYHNSVRDLLALEVDVASLLPGDDASYGFDNITVGNLSPTLLERYVQRRGRSAGWRWGARSRRPAGRP